MYDVIIIGGGPAGLNAAMLLGRSRRKVIVFDNGKHRNRWAVHMNGFLGCDGMDPREFIRIGREEVEKYGVEIQYKVIVSATHTKGHFVVNDDEGTMYKAKKLLLATGLKDKLPEIDGIEAFYGKSVYHCQYCDGWESRGKALAVYGRNRDGIGQALAMKTWSSNVTLFTDGTNKISRLDMELLQRNDVKICTDKITGLEGTEGILEHIILANGEKRAHQAMFFSTGSSQQCDLGEQLGCEFTNKGVIKTRRQQKSNIPGLYVAGDAARDMQLVIVAAAEGAKAGVAINMELQREERK
ncbi:NAD(P)/FAD-dependent oxidoreductase [Pontibacter fetidus]|nr:NAD(P)/FAD-dependent oxidoreductase [Pontibacter fetidus]